MRSPSPTPAPTPSMIVGPGRDGCGRLSSAFAAGERSALEETYQRYGPLVYTVALQALGDTPRAEDVTRTTFVAAWADRHDYHPDRISLVAWLMGITRYAIAAHDRPGVTSVTSTRRHP